ncbi:MAG: hypothetical protein JJU42_10260 [Rhodobacteraceae bacterium]|nr:hypothetical protein [Paracoccaceae bacterium]
MTGLESLGTIAAAAALMTLAACAHGPAPESEAAFGAEFRMDEAAAAGSNP